MKQFKSKIIAQSEEFQQNYSSMLQLVDELNKKLKDSQFEGRDSVIQRHHSQGKLLARERIDMLLDPNSPFLELLPLADCDKPDSHATSIAGIGLVNGVECLIGANVPTIKGGATNETTVKKYQRIDQIAMENRLPTISLVETAGADLTQQARVFHAGGSIFRAITKRSQAGIPTISVVFGSSTAGGAYTPGMSDYVIMVKKQAKVYLAGPPLVKMATGETTDHETLGGAEMHSKISGVSDYLAEDEAHAIQLCREVVGNLNYRKKTPLPPAHLVVTCRYDSREIIARLVDGSRMSEFKPLYGSTLVTTWANIHGFTIGILANNGPIFSDSANKATQFIELCDRRGIPLLFLHNVTGFMVGTKVEQEGIIKAGSRMINAVANRSVPAISIIVGASYGAGNYAMCGRAYDPRFLFAWPNAKVAVMGSDQLVGVLKMVQGNSKRGVPPEVAEQMAAQFKTKLDVETSSWYCTSRMIDDGIIDPRDTRDVVGMCLSIIHNSEIKQDGGFYGVHRM